jgi:hypothetical protein
MVVDVARLISELGGRPDRALLNCYCEVEVYY